MTEWTGDMADVADICGEDVAAMLVERLPGVYLYIPKKFKETGPINELPLSIAERLIKTLGGDEVYIPQKRITLEERIEAIERLLDKGLTVKEVALKIGLTETRIRQIRAKAGVPKMKDRPDPRQLDLF